MNWKQFKPHLIWVVVVIATVWIAQCQASAAAEQWGVDKTELKNSRDRVAALLEVSATIERDRARLRVDSARLVGQVTRLRNDSSRLASRAVVLRAEAQTANANWQRVVADWRVYADSFPGLRALIEAGTAAQASCQADTANCEQRAANAESRAATSVSQLAVAEVKAAKSDTAAMNAEKRREEAESQSAIWQRIAKPSLWDQIKQMPGRIGSTGFVVVVTVLLIKLFGL